jgi:hypothetical protein
MRQQGWTAPAWSWRLALGGFLTSGLCAFFGCATGVSFLDFTAPVPGTDIQRVVASWNSELQQIPGAAQATQGTPALAGQIHLFGPNGEAPVLGDGDLVVELCREDQVGDDQAIIPLQEWRIDRASLQHFRRKDAAGWGYDLVLPWGNYSPTVTRIQVRMRFEPDGGKAVQAANVSLTLASASRQQPLKPSAPLQVPAPIIAPDR